ncbi:unnamed protein product [Oikopleura dioica]|uniref:Protein kinase domain-containing protein n=1 Tax=Oikopleura dioica TaxID=34765 RepID=E4YNM2_OIKDI|nr:unnamed protein product [Oikopleura dioica]
MPEKKEIANYGGESKIFFQKTPFAEENLVVRVQAFDRGLFSKPYELRVYIHFGKENRLSWEPRKIILKKYYDGFGYLRRIGLRYYDRKPANILMHHGEPKICDFGLACMSKPKEAFQQMGYLRKGAKFQSEMGRSLGAGTPGFCSTCQLFDGWNTMIPIFRLTVFFIFDWPSAWQILYNGIDEQEREEYDSIMSKCGMKDTCYWLRNLFRVYFDGGYAAHQGYEIEQNHLFLTFVEICQKIN